MACCSFFRAMWYLVKWMIWFSLFETVSKTYNHGQSKTEIKNETATNILDPHKSKAVSWSYILDLCLLHLSLAILVFHLVIRPIIHLSGYICPIIQLSVRLSVYLSCQLFGQLSVRSVIKLFVQFSSSNNYLDKQFGWKCKSWDVDHRWNDDKTLVNSYL